MEVGSTVIEPDAPKVPNPAIVTEVALVAFQVNVVLEPLLIVVGCAFRTTVGDFRDEVLGDAAPPHPKVATNNDNTTAERAQRHTTDMTTPKN